MFALDDIRQARVFQEALQEGIQLGKQEGIQLGKQEGEFALLLRLIRRKFGTIDSDIVTTIGGLSLVQLEDLGENLLDFSSIDDLHNWLSSL